jgi:hypothetical protein
LAGDETKRSGKKERKKEATTRTTKFSGRQRQKIIDTRSNVVRYPILRIIEWDSLLYLDMLTILRPSRSMSASLHHAFEKYFCPTPNKQIMWTAHARHLRK